MKQLLLTLKNEEFGKNHTRLQITIFIRISEAHILPTIRIIHIIVQNSTVFQSEAMFHLGFALKIFEILIYICLCVSRGQRNEYLVILNPFL